MVANLHMHSLISHKSPAKGVRYNLLEEESRDNCLKYADWAGGYLYKSSI